MSVHPFSFSRMQVFDQCELRFDYQYVTASHRDSGSDASRYGNRVHESAEGYLRDGTALNAETAKYQHLFDRLKAAPGEKHYELQMAVKRDKTPCAWDDPECWVRGIADFAVVNGIQGYAGDWKTGKPKDDTLQLMLMACLLFAHFPELITVSTAYFWLNYPNAASPPVLHNRWSLDDYWAVWEKKAKAIDDAVIAGVFKPKPSGLCPWCPAYETCSYAKRKR